MDGGKLLWALTSGIRSPAFSGCRFADCTGIDKPTPFVLACTFFSRIERVGVTVTRQLIGGYLGKQFDVNCIPLYPLDK